MNVDWNEFKKKSTNQFQSGLCSENLNIQYFMYAIMTRSRDHEKKGSNYANKFCFS